MRSQKSLVLVIGFLSVLVGAAWFSTIDSPGHFRPEAINQQQNVVMLSPSIADVSQDWNVTWGGTSDDYALQCALDTTGQYVYFTGCTKSFGEVNGDAILVKYTINGPQVWNRTWGGSQYDEFSGIFVDSSDNIYASGLTSSFTVGGHDALLVKYDSSGNQIWNRTWGKTFNDIFTSIAMDTSGYLYLSTYYTVTGGNADMALVKYDSNGNQIWNRTWGTAGNDDIGNVAVDLNTNNIYLSGSSNNMDQKLLKYDSSGNLLWERVWGGTGQDLQALCAVDSTGNVYLSGRCNSFGLYWDVSLAKYNPAGTQLWNRTWGGNLADTPGDISIDSCDAIYITGHAESFGAGAQDIFVLKYDSAGNKLWNFTWGGVNNEWGNGIYLNGSSIYVSGRTASWGLGGVDAVLVLFSVSHEPTITGQSSTSYGYGTASHEISWIITDCNASGATYTIYHNDSEFGTPNQAWTSGQNVTRDVGGFPVGDHNVTIVAQDGWGFVSQSMVLVTVWPHVPNITGQSSTSYGYGTASHEISWTITDILISSATYTIYHNDSVFGTPNQGWTSGQDVTCDVGGFAMGDHNVTIVAQDGYGFVSQYMTLVSVSHEPIITGQSVANYTYGTTNNNITWHIIDEVTSGPTYTIYKNGSTWGTPNLSWTTDTDVWTDVDGLEGGYYNFSICAEDGLGLSSWATTILTVHAAPIITCPSEIIVFYGTPGNVINWTVLDNTTIDPRFTVYKNGSIWGTANQLWVDGKNISVNVDSLPVGYYNITLVTSDGFGFSTSHEVLLSVFFPATNGTWQDISLGYQLLFCAEKVTEYVELYLEGIATGGQIKITSFAANPLSVPLQGGIAYYSIDVDGWNKMSFPVPGKFFYDPAMLPEGVKAERLAVFHFENGQWVMIGGQVNVEAHYITINCPSFSTYAIAPIPDNNFPLDPAMMAWIIAIAVAALVAYGCIKFRKGKGGAEPEGFPELDFDL